MVIAKICVDGVTAVASGLSKIPKGIIGATIEVTFGSSWGGLSKTAVIRGAVTKDVLDVGNVVEIPAECVAMTGYNLKVGFYGTAGDTVAIPTVWADLGMVTDAADPSGDTTTDPALPVWAQLQNQVDDLKHSGGGGGSGGGGEADGFSPIAKVEQTDTGAVITITDKNGTTEATVKNGEDGVGIYTLADGETFDDVPDDVDMVIDPNIEADDVSELVQAVIAELPDSGINVTGAEVGQTIVVKAVDENGKPTEWEVADIPPDWEVIADITTTEEVTKLLIDQDANGEAFDLDEIEVMVYAQNLSKIESWYVYIGKSEDSADTINYGITLATNVTLICRYKKGSPFVSYVYKYGYEFQGSKLTREKLDTSGKAVPAKIDGFRMRHFAGGVLPIGTHIVVTGRRNKV